MSRRVRQEGTPPVGRAGKLRTIAYVLFAVIFVLGYAGRFVHPQYAWWLQLIAPLVPWLSLGVILLSIPVFRRASRAVQLAHGLLLLLVVIRFMPPVFDLVRSSWTNDRRTSDTFVVLVQNAKWREDETEDDTRAYLQQVEPHVVAYQEASVRFLDRGTGYSMEVVPAMRLGYRLPPLSLESQRRVNQPILTTLPADVFSEQSLSERGTRGTSDCARSVVTWMGTEIAIYNVHLRSYLRWGRPWDEEDGPFRRVILLISAIKSDVLARAQEAEDLRHLLEREQLPFVLGGDLNATRHNWEYRHLSRGLVDPVRRAGTLFPGTFPAALPLLRLDHVLVSQHWRVVDAEVGPALASDHRPVVASIVLQRNAPNPADDRGGARE